MLRYVPPDKTFAFGLQVYVGFLSLVLFGIGFIIYGGMQARRLPNPGLAAYEAPAAVRTLYPQPRTLFDGDVVAAPVAALDVAEPEQPSPTIGQSTSRREAKAATQASDRRKRSKRTASRARERRDDAVAAYAHSYAPYGAFEADYGRRWTW